MNSQLRIAASVLMCLCVLAAGCGTAGSNVKTGTLKGKVTYKGQPPKAGASIQFVGENGAGASGVLAADGSYTARTGDSLSLPVGIYKVSVNMAAKQMTPEQAMKAAQSGEDMSGKDIPEKYRNPNSSGEVAEVKEGSNTFNLDMKDE